LRFSIISEFFLFSPSYIVIVTARM
jgi:hypothetical protein